MWGRSTGNWAEDLGRTMHAFLVWGLLAMVLVPVLILVIIALVVFK